MNSRDFCFWLQGYMELTGGEYPPSVAWNLILEHLELAKENEDYSHDDFEGVVAMLDGFTAVAGNEQPTEAQWVRICDIVQGTFDKVTSTLDELTEEEENDFEKILEEIRKLPQPYTPPPPFLPPRPNPWENPWPGDKICDPLPWQQPIVTCSSGQEDNICASTEDLQAQIEQSLKNTVNTIEKLHNNAPTSKDVFCSSLDVACSALDSSYDSHAVRRGIGGDMYDLGMELADSKLGDR